MPEFPEYPKIPGPFKRHIEGPNRNKPIVNQWTSDELAALADQPDWIFTRKLDGTNIRVHWDGHDVHFGGRTDRAQIPGGLVDHLTETLREELFEQSWGERAVTLYGEGTGAKIQGSVEGAEFRFTLFDVLVDRVWLMRDGVEGVAQALGIPVVRHELSGTVWDAIEAVANGEIVRDNGTFAEGVVGTPALGLRDRRGGRIQVKVKSVDFKDGWNA